MKSLRLRQYQLDVNHNIISVYYLNLLCAIWCNIYFVAPHDTRCPKYGNFSQTLTHHDLVNQCQVS